MHKYFHSHYYNAKGGSNNVATAPLQEPRKTLNANIHIMIKLSAAEKKLTQIAQALPAILAVEAVNWTLANFDRQQWEGTSWPRAKSKKKTNALLVGKGSGRLRRGISVIGDNAFGVQGIPYARIHNEGGQVTHPARMRRNTFKVHSRGKYKGKTLFAKNNNKASFSRVSQGKSYTINIPQRKYLGRSPTLVAHLTQRAQDYVSSQL